MIPTAAPLTQPAWGLLIGLYFVLVGLPTGLTLVTSWLTTGDKHRGPTGRELERISSAAALGLLALAGLLLVVDLHRPERFFLMLTEFGNLSSPISVGAKLLALKMFLLLVALYFLRLRTAAGPDAVPAPGLTRRLARGLSIALVLVSLALALYPIAVLSFTWSSPLARTSGAFLIFLVTSLLMGVAGILVFTGLMPALAGLAGVAAHLALGLVVVHLVTLTFEGWSVSADPRLRESTVPDMLSGPWSLVFWSGLACLGAAAALLIMGRRLRRDVAGLRVAAGALLLIGAASTRYLFFAAGM